MINGIYTKVYKGPFTASILCSSATLHHQLHVILLKECSSGNTTYPLPMHDSYITEVLCFTYGCQFRKKERKRKNVPC